MNPPIPRWSLNCTDNATCMTDIYVNKHRILSCNTGWRVLTSCIQCWLRVHPSDFQGSILCTGGVYN